MAGRFPGANGVAVSNGKLFVGDARNGTVTIYRIDTGMGTEFERQIVSSMLLKYPLRSIDLSPTKVLGAAADNLKVVPTTGDIIATGTYKTFQRFSSSVWNNSINVPLSIPKYRGFGPLLTECGGLRQRVACASGGSAPTEGPGLRAGTSIF